MIRVLIEVQAHDVEEFSRLVRHCSEVVSQALIEGKDISEALATAEGAHRVEVRPGMLGGK